ncbi:MAG: rsmH [Clostridia bacterium]|jgi:16S rRNA (cytosine1402-N4)-methyltransferase|nr:rsmH [Clostridia bacterium]
MKFEHVPVLRDECILGLKINPDGIYVDGTLGGAGHASEICRHLSENGHLIGIDQDKNALEASKIRLENAMPKVSIINSNFEKISDILEDLDIEKIDGMLIDLGVSSHQLDEPIRGFSYMHDAPLDMRMNQEDTYTAYHIVNELSENELFRIIKDYGEENWARRIASFIVEKRENHPIRTTYDLVDIIKSAIPSGARKDGPHPAKRTFQAIRIAVNRELEIIEPTITEVIGKLSSGGRLCIITFHSLEDRIVKHVFKKLEDPCTCSKNFPVCICGKTPQVKIITKKPILPSDEEIETNPRSRSAKLRIIEKL